jgi:PAS domain S-box-containing protein
VPELILVHQKGIIKYVNPAALKTLGYTPEEGLNRPVSDFIVPEYLSRVAAALRQRPVGETVEPYEIEIVGKDGGRRTVIVSGSLIEFEGTPASLNVLTDITDRKALEVAVQQANRKLNLLSSITRHDIINQLTLLIGYIAISRRYLDDKKTLTTFLDKEEKAATTIERQIRFTKEYEDVGVAAPAWQNVSASVTQAVAELPVRAVRVEVDNHDLEIFADPLFEKVFYNLIDNALRYGGKGMTTIRVSSQESDTGLTILCEDDGAGISDEDKKRLFSKGFGKNTGLGLFLAREILAITGITIAENGAPGKGARFEITVPKGAYRFREKG